MELVVKGRRTRVSPQTRQRVERKVSRLTRLVPRAQRVEVELIQEATPRVDGGHRVEVECRTPRRTFRASASGPDVDAALDRVVERIERQATRQQAKRRSRLLDGANRVKSAMTAPSQAEPPPLRPEGTEKGNP